jgi:hypothetical protein
MNYLREPLKVDFGLLVCGPIMVHYYAKFGWQVLGRPIWIEQSRGRVSFSVPVMFLPVEQTAFPAGEVDLLGRPW